MKRSRVTTQTHMICAGWAVDIGLVRCMSRQCSEELVVNVGSTDPLM